jgi:hypothetical protein
MGNAEFSRALKEVSSLIHSKVTKMDPNIRSIIDGSTLSPRGAGYCLDVSEAALFLLLATPICLLVFWALIRSINSEDKDILLVDSFKFDMRFLVGPVLGVLIPVIYLSQGAIMAVLGAIVLSLLLGGLLYFVGPQIIDTPPLYFRAYIGVTAGLGPLFLFGSVYLQDCRGVITLSGGDPTLSLWGILIPFLLLLVWVWVRLTLEHSGKRIALTK